LGELEQRAMRLFARRLDRWFERYFPPWLRGHRFCAWVRVLVLRDCLAAARSIGRRYRARARRQARHRPHALADRVWLSMALDDLPDAESAVLALFLKGYSARRASKLLRLPTRQVRRVFSRGVARLLTSLGR
jgi:DNA-directed RNA polymerase specialized sigma24 family protein